MTAFLKKEWLEQVRSGRLLILGILFLLLGIMNPAIAKLTPWLFEVMAESLEESGMTVTAVTVDAMTSWTQFFKNIPMGLIAFVLLQSGIFTKEYQSGTLTLALTKGLRRSAVVLAKALVLAVLWTACYWLCYAVTYGYNELFWENSITQHLSFAALCWWVLGLWSVFLLVLCSAVAKSNSAVLAGTGVVFLAAYLIGLFPKISACTPAKLMQTAPLLSGLAAPDTYTAALTVSIILCAACIASSIPILNKKQL